MLAAHGARCRRWCQSLQCAPRATDRAPWTVRAAGCRPRQPCRVESRAAATAAFPLRLLYSLLCRAGWACSQQRAPSTAHDRRGAHCSDRHQRLHRAPCAASTLAVHSSARHALQLRAASRCSVACALPETAQGCGSVRSTLLERCRWPAVHVVRWGFVGRSFQRTARTLNFYYFRSSVQLLAPCTPQPGGPPRPAGPCQWRHARRASQCIKY